MEILSPKGQWTGIFCLGCLGVTLGWGYVAPGPEEEDGYYRDPVGLTERWYSAVEVELRTPGAKKERWSTVEEVYRALEQLAAERPGLEVREVGESLLGIPIKALFHEVERGDALTVLIQARVHGNEPASTEGALELAYELAQGSLADLEINIIILPVLNPEGARAMRRRTGTDIDPNRDYILQNSGCIRAVYGLMQEYDPEVVLDMHEHDAYAWPYDLMTIGPNNPNIPHGVRDFTAQVMVGDMEQAFEAEGLRLGPYRLLDFQEDGIRVRESATTFVSEKNALAMSGRISLLTEGRGIGLGAQHFRRRTFAQYTAARAVVKAAAWHEAEIRKLVTAARETIKQETDEWIFRVEPMKVPSRHELVNAESLEAEWVDTTYWERTQGTVTGRMDKPAGYVIHASQTDLLDRLRRFGLEMIPVEASTVMAVETMVVESIHQRDDVLYGGEMQREDGCLVRPAVLRNHDIRIRTRLEQREVPAGSQVILTGQPNALYLITLEPSALSGFAALSFWGADLTAGFEFPVYRLRTGGQ